MAFLLGGFYLLLSTATTRCAVWAATLFVLAVYTKQAFLFVPLFLAIPLLITDRRRAFAFLVVFLGGCALMSSVFLLVSDGWYWYYTVAAPSHHEWVPSRIIGFWQHKIAPTVPLAFLACLCISVLPAPVEKHDERTRRWLLTAFLLGSAAVSWLTWAHRGGTLNSYLPVFAALAVGSGVALGMALSTLDSHPHATRLALVALTAVGIQFLLLAYNPASLRPRPVDRTAAERLLAVVKESPGDVWVPSHSWIQRQAGKPPGVFWGNLAALREHNSAGTSEHVFIPTDLANLLQAKRYSRIILDENAAFLRGLITPAYRESGRVFSQRPDEAVTSVKTACYIYERQPCDGMWQE